MKIFFHLSHQNDPNVIRFIMNGFSGPAATLLFKLRVSANMVTVIRGLLVTYGLYCFSTGEYIFYLRASIILILNMFLDCVDGDLARLHKNVTEIGEWLEGVTGNVLSKMHSLTGLFITVGIYKQTNQIYVWYVLFFILFGYIMNSIFRDFAFHQTSTVDSMKKGFQSEYEMFKGNSFLKKIIFTLLSVNEYLVLLSVIFYGSILHVTGLNPLFLALVAICGIYQIRWLSRIVLQIKYFLTK